MKIIYKILFIFAWIFHAELLEAACNNLTLRPLPSGTVVFADGALTPTLSVDVRSGASTGCSFFIGIDSGTSSTDINNRVLERGTTNEFMPVQIYKDSSYAAGVIIKDKPAATSASNFITGTMPAAVSGNTTITTSYFPKLTAPNYQTNGTYQDTFALTLYEGSVGGAYATKNSRNLVLRYVMPKLVDLSLVDTGQPFNLSDNTQTANFGSLVSGATRSFDIVVKYNAGYRVRVSSLRNGKIKHATVADTINYTMTVGGTPVNLTNSATTPVEVVTGSGLGPAAGTRFATVITMGTVGTVRAGNYSDTVTITVVTQ